MLVEAIHMEQVLSVLWSLLGQFLHPLLSLQTHHISNYYFLKNNKKKKKVGVVKLNTLANAQKAL